MAIHIPGLMAIVVFYLLIVVVGIWASRKSKQSGASADSEDVMLAGRNIGLLIGIFTMTEYLGIEVDPDGILECQSDIISSVICEGRIKRQHWHTYTHSQLMKLDLEAP
ncbi:high-affinity choline transporter 1-like [Plakobranchus ocellatus]|uniref:High-affinity choline transporter 1-like n=1 Tax=Plakobranchus ocellatus TaxID=259542 RepID=A0AAV3YWG6_9GAST|nr:high-affinity choline transporter 1-like [Plakobranchus ocellatus]